MSQAVDLLHQWAFKPEIPNVWKVGPVHLLSALPVRAWSPLEIHIAHAPAGSHQFKRQPLGLQGLARSGQPKEHARLREVDLDVIDVE